MIKSLVKGMIVNMLRQLTIRNIALIDNISIEFCEGLNIMTGETGAGKSIIIDSINAVLGERISRDIIRTGEDTAFVEAVFDCRGIEGINGELEKAGIEPEEDGTIIISKEFSNSGKNICRVNNRAVTSSVLKDIGRLLIDMHGQHDNQSLFNVSTHIKLLDSFSSKETDKLVQEYASKYIEYKKVQAEIRNICTDTADRERRKDFLSYQIDEIRNAGLKPGEEEELVQKKNIYSNSQKIMRILDSAYTALSSASDSRDPIINRIFLIHKDISEISNLDEKYGSISASLESVGYQLQETVRDIRNMRDAVEYDPAALEEIEERLDVLSKLKRKYGGTTEEIIDSCNSMESELEGLVNSEETLQLLKEKESRLESELLALSKKLSDQRRSAASLLEDSICKVLEEVEMKNSRFKVDVKFNDTRNPDGRYDFNERGLDRVEFLISTNVGEPLKPLSKIVSGGESSRIMLAIKSILANADNIPTLIFDEIDMGISGKTAQRVGLKMSLISRSHQVICVTHLAQIACVADSHYLISKHSDALNTRTTVSRLDPEGRVDEIARILSGSNITALTISHAREMLETAARTKSEEH